MSSLDVRNRMGHLFSMLLPCTHHSPEDVCPILWSASLSKCQELNISIIASIGYLCISSLLPCCMRACACRSILSSGCKPSTDMIFSGPILAISAVKRLENTLLFSCIQPDHCFMHFCTQNFWSYVTCELLAPQMDHDLVFGHRVRHVFGIENWVLEMRYPQLFGTFSSTSRRLTDSFRVIDLIEKAHKLLKTKVFYIYIMESFIL